MPSRYETRCLERRVLAGYWGGESGRLGDSVRLHQWRWSHRLFIFLKVVSLRDRQFRKMTSTDTKFAFILVTDRRFNEILAVASRFHGTTCWTRGVVTWKSFSLSVQYFFYGCAHQSNVCRSASVRLGPYIRASCVRAFDKTQPQNVNADLAVRPRSHAQMALGHAMNLPD